MAFGAARGGVFAVAASNLYPDHQKARGAARDMTRRGAGSPLGSGVLLAALFACSGLCAGSSIATNGTPRAAGRRANARSITALESRNGAKAALRPMLAAARAKGAAVMREPGDGRIERIRNCYWRGAPCAD